MSINIVWLRLQKYDKKSMDLDYVYISTGK